MLASGTVQGYLAHKKHPPPRTLQWDLGSYDSPSEGGCLNERGHYRYPCNNLGGLGVGDEVDFARGKFLRHEMMKVKRRGLQGYLAHKKHPPPRTLR